MTRVKPLSSLKFIDLFAGIGGFRLALESLGARCAFTSEWNAAAREVYATNFACPEGIAGDITNIPASAIPSHDILCAGFPCQAFSISGKKRGFQDTRGTLFFEVARIAKHHRPRIVFLENVKNFATHDSDHTLAVVQRTLEGLGYSFHFKVINSAEHGVPQCRERIYMLGFREDVDTSGFSFPKGYPLHRCVRDILLPHVPQSVFIDRAFQLKSLLPHVSRGAPVPIKPLRVGQLGMGRQGERVYSPQGVGITLSAYGGGLLAKTGGYLIGNRVRRLLPREAARLMSFPDTFRLHPNTNQAYQQLGNAVVVDVLKEIASRWPRIKEG